jgi:histidinol-phosphate aminotransferase
MYEVLTTALGGKMVTVPLGPSFELDVDAVARAVTSATRIVCLANPHNPSGRFSALDGFLELAERIAPVLLLADEAYADFCAATLIRPDTFARHPNLVVGRTFSKSYGLAGLRAGALVGAPDTLTPMRAVVPPYSLNAWAAAALPIAVADTAYRDWYCDEARASRELLAGACASLGLDTWPSAANFVLVRVGARAAEVVSALAARGIKVRNRSHEAGCDGCIRITAGVVDDTRRAIAALEEVLCAAP